MATITITGTIQIPPQTMAGTLDNIAGPANIELTGTPALPSLGASGVLAAPRQLTGPIVLPGLQAGGVLKAPIRWAHIQRYALGIPVQAQHAQPYALKVSTQHTQRYENVKVRNQHTQPYTATIQIQHAQPYRSVILSQHRQPIHYKVGRGHVQTYSLQAVVRADHIQPYPLLVGDPVVAQHTQVYALRVGAQHNQPYEQAQAVRAQFTQPYQQAIPVASQHAQPYENNAVVKFDHEQAYSLLQVVTNQNTQPYESLINVANQHTQEYDLKNVNPVVAQNTQFYDLLAVTIITITDIPSIIHNGNTIKILNASVVQDEGDYPWKCAVNLADIADYKAMNIGDAFTVNLVGELYEMVVQSKSISRNAPAQVSLTLEGISPTVVLDSPQATLITKTWDTAIYAKDAAEEAAGQTIDWTLQNWIILSNRLSVQEATPISVVQLIARAGGGVVETKPDGTLKVRPKYPVSVPDWPTATLDHTFTDASDNVSISEKLQKVSTHNKICIADIAAAGKKDVLEFIATEGDTTSGTLKAYPSPYRSNFTIAHTGLTSLQIVSLGEIVRQETEEVDFVAGVGSVQYPAHSIDVVEWIHLSLGSVNFTANETEITAPVTNNCGYGRARITYTTKSFNYAIVNTDDEDVMFVLIDN